MSDLREKLKQRADTAYCTYIDQLKRDECLGVAGKIASGKFTVENLKAHERAEKFLGMHQAFHEVIRMLDDRASLTSATAPDDLKNLSNIVGQVCEDLGIEPDADDLQIKLHDKLMRLTSATEGERNAPPSNFDEWWSSAFFEEDTNPKVIAEVAFTYALELGTERPTAGVGAESREETAKKIVKYIEKNCGYFSTNFKAQDIIDILARAESPSTAAELDQAIEAVRNYTPEPDPPTGENSRKASPRYSIPDAAAQPEER